MKNKTIAEMLAEVGLNESEMNIFMESIKETKKAQLDDSVDAKAEILKMIKEEFK